MSVCLVSIYWSAILLCTEFTVSTLLLVVFSDIYFLRFYLGFLYFVTIQILIQPLQYCVMARWLLFWLEDVTALLLLSTNSDESLTVLYVNKYKVFIFHWLLQHAK